MGIYQEVITESHVKRFTYSSRIFQDTLTQEQEVGHQEDLILFKLEDFVKSYTLTERYAFASISSIFKKGNDC